MKIPFVHGLIQRGERKKEYLDEGEKTEIHLKVEIERLGGLLIEGGKLLCVALSPTEARGIFGEEQPRKCRQISDDLISISQTYFLPRSRAYWNMQLTAKKAGNSVGDYVKTTSATTTTTSSSSFASSSSSLSSTSTRGGRGVLQNILINYVEALGIYMLLPEISDDHHHQRENIDSIITFLGSYGIRKTPILDMGNYDMEGEKFVGLERDVEMLVEHLVTSTGDTNVIAICGVGGLGKSAMARHILQHPKVQRHFSASALVRMTPTKKPWERQSEILSSLVHEEIQSEILSSLVHEEIQEDIIEDMICDNIDSYYTVTRSFMEELKKRIIEAQKNNTCLVVLDDMWNERQWDEIKDTFPNGLGTKLLVTTRDIRLATNVDPGAFIYRQRFLNEVEIWELFKHRLNWDSLRTLLQQPDQETRKVEEIGRKMIRRCHGLPFPVVTLAKLMSQRSTLSEWELLDRIVDSYRIGDIDMGNGSASHVLGLSGVELVSGSGVEKFFKLDLSLERSFLYLCSLPGDYHIDAERLFLLWIAESNFNCEKYVDMDLLDLDILKGRTTLMEVAENYLNELEQRMLVKVKVDESDGRTKFVHVDEIFRNLYYSSKKSIHKFHVHDLRDPEKLSPYDRSLGLETYGVETLGVAIYLRNHEDLKYYVPPERQIAKKICSELFFLQNYKDRSRISRRVQSHLSDLKMIKVLDLGGLVFSKLDKVIGQLVHLKYLGLRYAVFHELPSTIVSMKSLQTLDIRDDDTQYASVTLPSVLWSMSQLKFLYLRTMVWSNKERDKFRCGKMEGLEIFENFDSRVLHVEDLSSLTKLSKLRAKTCKIFDLEKITAYLENRNALSHLRDFSLSIKYCDLYSEEGQNLLERVFKCPVLYELSIDGRTGKLPMYQNDFSQCLAKITLENCELINDPMVTLEKLPNLRSLFVKWNAFVGKGMVCSATGFPQLRILQLQRMWRLEKWTVEQGGMPKLSSLEIISCPALEMIPDGLQSVSDLKEVVIGLMPESFTNRLRVHEGGTYGDDRHKLQHASIKILYRDGNEERVPKNTDATTGEGVVIIETASSTSRTISRNNTRPDNGKGKAPMTESYAESAMDNNEDDDNFMHSDMDNIWQLGLAQSTSQSK